MKLAAASAQLGGVIPFTVTLLFLPVARGSPILRLIDVPFEQAVRYHRWIGNLTMLLVTIHGVLFAIYAGSTNQLSLVSPPNFISACGKCASKMCLINPARMGLEC